MLNKRLIYAVMLSFIVAQGGPIFLPGIFTTSPPVTDNALIAYDGTSGRQAQATGAISQDDGSMLLEVPVTIDTAASITLTRNDCLGTVRANGDDDIINYELPPVEEGLALTLVNYLFAKAITADAASGDIIILNDGTALASGNAIDTAGLIDDKITLLGLDNTYWLVVADQNGSSDGGAD